MLDDRHLWNGLWKTGAEDAERRKGDVGCRKAHFTSICHIFTAIDYVKGLFHPFCYRAQEPGPGLLEIGTILTLYPPFATKSRLLDTVLLARL